MENDISKVVRASKPHPAQGSGKQENETKIEPPGNKSTVGNQPKITTDNRRSLTGRVELEGNKSLSGNLDLTKMVTEEIKSISGNENIANKESKTRTKGTGNSTKIVIEAKKSSKGTNNYTRLVVDVTRNSTKSDKSSRSETKRSSSGLEVFECNVCHQQFPYPMHLLENHAVVPLQCSNLNTTEPSIEEESGQSPSIKSGSSLATKPRFLACGKDSMNVNMGGDIPIFPKVKSIFIHSGNIINWNRLKGKPKQSSSEEICDIIGKTLGVFLEREDKTQLQYVTEIYKVNAENIQKLQENEREEVKITVKLFIFMPQPTSVISETVNKVLNELGTSFIETLLLAVCPAGEANKDSLDTSLNLIQPYWEAMEELVYADKVFSLGICDMGKDGLEELYNLAKVKPCIDQVNLESCCLMPQDLTEYAKSVNIQLLTHNDKPEEELHETIQNVSTEPDSRDWTPQWVVRYSGILKCRSIIKTQAYIMHARRGNRKLML